MTDSVSDTVNHLRVTFNLKAPVVNAFIQDQPHQKLRGLRALLDTFSAKVSSAGKHIRDTKSEGFPVLKELGDLAKEAMSKNPRLAQKFDRQVTVELSDDRNVKAFAASLELGPYDDVINKQSIKIETHSYDETEISQAIEGNGIVKPPFPPANARYVLE